MAFDAAAPAAPPATPGTSAAVKPAGRKSDSTDPFGALVAMLDQANAEAPAPEVSAAAPDAQGAEIAAAPKAGSDDVPAKDDKSAEAPALDAANPVAAMMVAAMMAPAPPPTAASAAIQAAEPTGGAATGSAMAAAPADFAPVPATADEPAVTEGAELPAKSAGEAAPTLQAPMPVEADKPAARAVAAAPAEPQPAVTGPQAQAAPQTAPMAAAQAVEQPQPQPQPPTADQTRVAAAIPPVQDGEAHPDGAPDPRAQDRENGASADADATQQVQARKAPASDAAQTFAQPDLADAAPQAPSSPSQPPPPAASAAAPVITAQAAVTPVRGSPETVAHLAAQMIQRLDGRTTRFDLSLNPQSLGRVDVRIEIGAKGALRARMAFDDAASAHELSGRHAELRAALQSAGFDVPEGAITYDVASGGGSGTGGAFAERQDANGHAAPSFNTLADTADQDAAASVQTYFRAAGSSGLDIRV